MTVCFLYKIEEEIGHFNFQLGGMETSKCSTAIPIYAKQLLDLDIHSFVFRKQPKEYAEEESINL